MSREDNALCNGLDLIDMAARYVHKHGGSLCDALHHILPEGHNGTVKWWEAKHYLECVMPDEPEERAYWWKLKDRNARVLGALFAIQFHS